MRRIIVTLIALALTSSVGLAAAAPASALSCTPSVPRGTCKVYDVQRVSTSKGVKGKKLVACKAGNTAQTCSLTNSYAVTGTVQTAFGVSGAWVQGQLGVSGALSRTVTASCSKKIKAGQTYTAYAIQDVYKYKVRKYSRGPGQKGLETSSVRTMTKVQPGVACYVS